MFHHHHQVNAMLFRLSTIHCHCVNCCELSELDIALKSLSSETNSAKNMQKAALMHDAIYQH